MINNIDILSQHLLLKESMKSSINDEDLRLKLRQIQEITNCNEEQGILILHDCNYNVEVAINKILNIDSQNDFQWKTKKSRQRKVQLKSKETEKIDLNNNIKDKKKTISSNDGTPLKQLNQDAFSNGRTFRNFNLLKRDLPRCIINDTLNNQFHPTIMNLNNKWDGKSIIIENCNFLSIDDLSSLIEAKVKIAENTIVSNTDVLNKEDINSDSSIMFKTHCSTKPPPKVQYSLEAPVQMMNKNLTNRTLPKLKFGDTDFYENAHNTFSEAPLNTAPVNINHVPESSVINVEDNSIIKVGPSQKLSNFPIHQDIFNTNTYLSQKGLTQSMLTPSKNIEYSKINNSDYDNFRCINNTVPCNTAYPSLGSYVPTHINNIKDISNNSKPHDMFFNQPQSNLYSSQSNVNHPKSTIYLVPNMMMQNSINSLYMTVANPLPASALSPPIPHIPSQYNVPPQIQNNPIYFDELHQNDDTSLRMNRPFNQARQQNFNRSKKPYPDLQDDSVLKNEILKANLKNMSNFPLNQTQLSKQMPLNYSLYIAPAQNRSQLIPNTLSHFPSNIHSQDLSGFDRKRNMQMSSNNFIGKPWS